MSSLAQYRSVHCPHREEGEKSGKRRLVDEDAKKRGGSCQELTIFAGEKRGGGRKSY